MRVLIAEDEPLARALLRTLLEEAGDVEIVGEARNGREAVTLAERVRPDAVFLDIDMPGGGGIDAAHALQSRAACEIVFVTAHEPHAVDAFELGAADYVLKPLRRVRLAKALERVRARLREKDAAAAGAGGNGRAAADSAFWVRTRHGRVRVELADIVWIEAARDHVYLHTEDQSYLHRITMEELEEKLDGTDIVRVHRSAFVRLGRISAVQRSGKSVHLRIGEQSRVCVGPSYQASTLRRLMADEGGRPAR
ncbi:MAG: LytR/AlgR family response regulator transcription factor [Allosphingosinicella sp.]